MGWNAALDKFIEIKNVFIKRYGEAALWNYEGISCIEYWVEKLEDEKYMNLISCLKFTEYEDMLMICYYYLNRAVRNGIADTIEGLWQAENGFYCECRSVVINIKEDELVLTPFRKFHNLNAVSWTKEDVLREKIKNAKYVEISKKLDGSMQSARWYKGKLVMAGTKALDMDKAYRLKHGYQTIMENDGYLQMVKDYSSYTCIFEYVFLDDRHVVKYGKENEGMYLVGIRDVRTGEELPYHEIIQIAEKYGIKTTDLANTSFDRLLDSLDEKKAHEAEGYVLNVDGLKVKIKYNDFVTMHKSIMQYTSPNFIIKSIADNTWDDIYPKIPEQYKSRADAIADEIFRMVDIYDKNIKRYLNALAEAGINGQKDVMSWIHEFVPKKYESYVRETWLGKECSYLKTRNGRYLKPEEVKQKLEDGKNP